jgi:hypothetical protein
LAPSSLPIVPGHGIVGVVKQSGNGVKKVKEISSNEMIIDQTFGNPEYTIR